MDLILWNPLPVIYDAYETIVETNPTIRALTIYFKRILCNPLYLMLFSCYIVTILTPVLFYIFAGFLTVVGLTSFVVSSLGFMFGGISIVVLISLSMLYGIFLIFGAQVSAATYVLKKMGIC